MYRDIFNSFGVCRGYFAYNKILKTPARGENSGRFASGLAQTPAFAAVNTTVLRDY